MSNQDGNFDVVHVPLEVMNGPPNNYRLDELERDMLHRQGAFLLPPRSLQDELVAAFFKFVAPMLPIFNKHQFMRRYRDSSHPPSLLLLQSVFLVGLKVSTSSQLHGGGRSNAVAMAFYKRAKALYDADYESDRVAVVQSLILIGWYWAGSEDDSGKYYNHVSEGITYSIHARCDAHWILLDLPCDCSGSRIWHAPQVRINCSTYLNPR
jgi:hypothetical protein